MGTTLPTGAGARTVTVSYWLSVNWPLLCDLIEHVSWEMDRLAICDGEALVQRVP